MTRAGPRYIENVGPLWRVGKSDDPFRLHQPAPVDPTDPSAGNRFDSYIGDYEVLYFGTSQEACFGETLADFRSDPKLTFIKDEWEERGFMMLGGVPADWRLQRIVVQASVAWEPVRLLNVENGDVLALLWRELGPTLTMLGHDRLDIDVIRGPDRRVTRLISQWAYGQNDVDGAPMFDGVRFLSCHDTDWECCAVFGHVPLNEEERESILLENPALQQVAKRYGLRLF